MEYMNNEHSYPRVGYAFVQQSHLSKVYTPKKALEAGTIFPELNIGLNDYKRGIRKHGR